MVHDRIGKFRVSEGRTSWCAGERITQDWGTRLWGKAGRGIACRGFQVGGKRFFGCIVCNGFLLRLPAGSLNVFLAGRAMLVCAARIKATSYQNEQLACCNLLALCGQGIVHVQERLPSEDDQSVIARSGCQVHRCSGNKF